MKLWAMPCRVIQDGQVTVESSDKTCSTGDGNGKPLQYSCLENPVNSIRQKVWRWRLSPPRSVGVQYAIRTEWRNLFTLLVTNSQNIKYFHGFVMSSINNFTSASPVFLSKIFQIYHKNNLFDVIPTFWTWCFHKTNFPYICNCNCSHCLLEPVV